MIESTELLHLVTPSELNLDLSEIDKVSLSEEECVDLMNSIEVAPDHVPKKQLDPTLWTKVSLENIDDVIAKGIVALMEERRNLHKDRYMSDRVTLEVGDPAFLPSYLLEDVHQKMSAPHLFQCSINSIVSITRLKEFLVSFQTLKPHLEHTITMAQEVIERVIALEKIMILLLTLEFKKKASFEKNDPQYFQEARRTWPFALREMKGEVEAFREMFVQGNKPIEEERKGKIERVIKILTQVEESDFSLNPQKDHFYVDICSNFGNLMLYDYEGFYERRMRDLCRALDVSENVRLSNEESGT